MRYLTALAILVGIGVHAPSIATSRQLCSVETYERADASLGKAARAWLSLQQHQKTFGPCDDGALAEGYSDAVVTLLARHWDQFDAFEAMSEKRPAFRRWAIRHIDATTSSDDLERVERNAAKCSGNPKTEALCAEIVKAARAAIDDQSKTFRTIRS